MPRAKQPPKSLRHSTGSSLPLPSSSSVAHHNTTAIMDTSEISISDLAPVKPGRRSGRLLLGKSRSNMEDSSSRTATTVQSSYNHGSSLLMMGDESDSMSASIRSQSLNDTSLRRRELRNLQGIRRRRSDPVTRRWREQCSKLYKEHVLLDSCREEQPPPLLSQPQVEAARKIQACFRNYLASSQQQP